MVRRHLGFSKDEWEANPQWLNDHYWEHLLTELLPDPDSDEGWDNWDDDPNVVRG